MSSADHAERLERKSADSSTTSTSTPKLTSEANLFALVKHPSDPGNPEGKLALGVRCRAERKARQQKKEDRKSGVGPATDAVEGNPVPQVQQVSAVPYYPRPTRPTCVPSKALSCFCTVDILYD